MKDRNKAIATEKAKKWLAQNCLILDTETTGLDAGAEIVEIAIINCRGEVLLNTLVQPQRAIPDDAIAIHGITNEMVKDAPVWSEIHSAVMALINPEGFLAYNSDFDARMIAQSVRASMYQGWGKSFCSSFSSFVLSIRSLHGCVMLNYAEYFGEWDDRRDNYKWQRLTAAAEQQGVTVEGQPHRALTDCLLTLGVIKAMAAAR